MSTYEKGIDIIDKRQYHKIRPSYLYNARHMSDNYINLGYDYAGNVLKNGTSPELWANPQQIPIFAKIEGILVYLIESSKMVKKWFSIAHSKDTTLIN